MKVNESEHMDLDNYSQIRMCVVWGEGVVSYCNITAFQGNIDKKRDDKLVVKEPDLYLNLAEHVLDGLQQRMRPRPSRPKSV